MKLRLLAVAGLALAASASAQTRTPSDTHADDNAYVGAPCNEQHPCNAGDLERAFPDVFKYHLCPPYDVDGGKTLPLVAEGRGDGYIFCQYKRR